MKHSFLLLPNDSGATVACYDGRQVATRVAAWPDVAAVLREMGYTSQGLCLALESARVLHSRIDCSDLPRKHRDEARRYLLEEQLPLDLEQVTVDFLPAAGAQALGLAVETAPLRKIIDDLAQQGVTVLLICPLAILALWQLKSMNLGPVDYLVLAGPSDTDVLRLSDGNVRSWYHAGESGELVRHIQADLLADPCSAPPRLALAGPGALARDALAAAELAVEKEYPADALALAAQAAARLGSAPAWINLRQGALASGDAWGPLKKRMLVTVALALLLPAVLAAAFFVKAAQFAQAAQHARQEQAQVYRQLYPDSPVPLLLKKQLQGEARKTAALSGLAESDDVPQRSNVLDPLRAVAASLPKALRVQVRQLAFDADDLTLDGQVRTHSDAETLRAGLLREGFSVEPPKTEALPAGGVAFLLSGRWNAASQPAEGQP